MRNSFVHLDLSVDEIATTKKFYAKVFDRKLRDVPDMGWTAVDVGKGVGGGIGKKQMPGQASSWIAYAWMSLT